MTRVGRPARNQSDDALEIVRCWINRRIYILVHSPLYGESKSLAYSSPSA
jgi:hypothetical protein